MEEGSWLMEARLYREAEGGGEGGSAEAGVASVGKLKLLGRLRRR